MTRSSAVNSAMSNRNWDDDMSHVRNAADLKDGQTPRGVYGDTVGGKSFSDEQSELLIAQERRVRPVTACGWRDVWAGPGMTKWTIINCRPETQDEIDAYREASASM